MLVDIALRAAEDFIGGKLVDLEPNQELMEVDRAGLRPTNKKTRKIFRILAKFSDSCTFHRFLKMYSYQKF
jgi:hypothetical protein